MFIKCTNKKCNLKSAARQFQVVSNPSYALFAFMVAILCGTFASGADFEPDKPNLVKFPPEKAKFVRLVIHGTNTAQVCIDELELYGPESDKNLALEGQAQASSCLASHAIHKISHLNDGIYGNDHSWIAASSKKEWVQIELAHAVSVDKVVFSRDRKGQFRDRVPQGIEVQISVDGENFKTVKRIKTIPTVPEISDGPEEMLQYAFECEELMWEKAFKGDHLDHVLGQMAEIIERFSAQQIDVSKETAELLKLRQRKSELEQTGDSIDEKLELLYQARLAKRELFLRAPELDNLRKILFVKRQAFAPTHNYSVILDATGAPGGEICTLDMPRKNGRLEPSEAKLNVLFDAENGIARNPVCDFETDRIYFGYRKTTEDYFHIYEMNADGGNVKQITDGPFHDYFPCPLPGDRLAFITTRCKARFLCWRPQAFALFAMDTDGSNIEPLSHANLSEWTPSLMKDGRIIWMRSEYIDKGADFGHTLWAIRPDGTHPELIFGNNTLNCYANGNEVPQTNEILCTLVAHGGDLNGPIALIDLNKGKSNPEAITNITPDVEPHYHMSWAQKQCFRDPVPISRDYYLCSHAAYDRFGLYVIDRYGNRELIYIDPDIDCMASTILNNVPDTPMISESIRSEEDMGTFFVADVYEGLNGVVERGAAKYIRVCQEIRADLIQFADGQYQNDHVYYEDWYATPTHKVGGPYGWPSYVAKGDLGIVPVEEDGSANFYAPSGKVLYFQLLDKDYNEIQRMRSVIQLQPGENRGCIGCHEDRMSSPISARPRPVAVMRQPSRLKKPSWGGGPFSYEKVVQPVLNDNCVRCHSGDHKGGIVLTGDIDRHGVPASYRTFIEKGLVHHFDYVYAREHNKAEPMTFGTVKSKLWKVLDKGHHKVELTPDEVYRIKSWIDLNCPLWPDYQFRLDREQLRAQSK